MAQNKFNKDLRGFCILLAAEVLNNNLIRICKGKPPVLKEITAEVLQYWALYGGVPAFILSFENSEDIRQVMEEMERRYLLEVSSPSKRNAGKKAEAFRYMMEGMEKLRKKFEN